MVLLVWPPAEHLWIGRNRGQFAPYDAARWPLRRTTLAEDPGSTRPERHFPSGAAQTRVVSAPRIRLDPRKSVRSYKGIIYGDISEFESYMLPRSQVSLSSDGRRWRTSGGPTHPDPSSPTPRLEPLGRNRVKSGDRREKWNAFGTLLSSQFGWLDPTSPAANDLPPHGLVPP